MGDVARWPGRGGATSPIKPATSADRTWFEQEARAALTDIQRDFGREWLLLEVLRMAGAFERLDGERR